MVAIRSIHLNPAGEFDVTKWINDLEITHPSAKDNLMSAWQFCLSVIPQPLTLHVNSETLTLEHSLINPPLHNQSAAIKAGQIKEEPKKDELRKEEVKKEESKKPSEQDIVTAIWRGLEMVEILTALNMDNDTLVASLLFPWVNNQLISVESVTEQFGEKITALIRGVLQMDAIRELKSAQIHRMGTNQIDNMRKMLLAMVDDFRCVVIALAERIVFLRELKDAPEDERVLAAKASSSIYAPLANRLGIGQLKWEIEDYCFRYLKPNEYKQIANLLDERRLDRQEYIQQFVKNLQQEMISEGINAEVYGRPKHIYSIYKKMQKKHLNFEELYDVRAIRIVVERLQDCYAALGVVHTHHRHIPSEFDDYIANPKPNGYQSIHTVVLGPQGKALEIQIRTRQMHEDAELGVAAHWKYKEGTNKNSKSALEERINWLRKLLTWQEEMIDSSELLEEVRSQVFDDRVYVFTPQGDVIDLPNGSTPLDFAYHIHSDIGNRCIGAKVAGRIVPFTYQLQMGDQIEIITQKTPNPSRDWLNPHSGYLTSSRARAKVQNWFRKQDKDKNILAGKQILEDELSQLAISLKDAEKYLLKKYNVTHIDEFLASLGAGDIRIQQMANYLAAQFNKVSAKEQDEEVFKQLTESISNKNKAKTEHQKQREKEKVKGRVVVDDVGNLLHHLAGCCQPIIGDSILGFITQGRGISIHRSDCEQFLELQHQYPERIVEAKWGETYSSGHQLTLRVISNDRSGLLRDITTVLANEKINVLGINSRSDVKNQTATIDMKIEIYNLDALGRTLIKLNQIKGIIEAKRLSS